MTKKKKTGWARRDFLPGPYRERSKTLGYLTKHKKKIFSFFHGLYECKEMEIKTFDSTLMTSNFYSTEHKSKREREREKRH